MTTATKLRNTLLRCAREATAAEPNSVEYRLHAFIAKLSGSMEGMGELELDAALWQMLQTPPALASTTTQPSADDQVAMAWWNSITEERRRHWLSVAGSAVPADAWRAFVASENNLAMES